MKKILTIVLSTALLSGCGLYKNYERPADRISTEGIYGAEQSGDSIGFGDCNWRNIFTDPQLQALVEKTLAQNTNMQQADIAIQEAEAYLKCAKLAYIPSITFSPNGKLTKVLDQGTSLNKTYEFPVAISWQLGSMGNLRNSKKKAKVLLEQTKEVKLAVQTQLVATVATLYYNLVVLDENYRLVEQTLANWKKTLEVTKAFMKAGYANAAAVASTEANVYSIETNLIDLKNTISDLEFTLCNLMRETPHHIQRGTFDSWRTPAMVSTGVPCRLLERRIDVRQAELELAAAFYDKNLALSQFFPGLNITGSLDWTNSLGGTVVNPGKVLSAVIASITQPIFRNGALRAQYKVSKLEMERLTLAFQQKVLDAGLEVNTAVRDIKNAEAKKPLLRAQVESLTRAVDATQKLWQSNGSATYLQVLTAQTSLLQAQLGELNNKLASVVSTITLYQALGGGVD
ncbi:MAG: TolC family protein [Bacteroidales bacterium]|nr:TolC family protein [Candidatus Physcousia equi]